ncbi:MAG: SufE family protein [Flavobacteriales bacterium]|nr:SufE family protein [Flavobacteriales bacterium]
MSTAVERQEEIIDEFAFFEDWMQKYEHIIELGKDLPLIDEQFKTDEQLIKGCQSRVWLYAELKDGKIHFTADSDAIITKGMVALMIRVLDGLTPLEVVDADMSFIKEIGLTEHLSPTRSNGLASMVKQMKFYGLAFSGRQE